EKMCSNGLFKIKKVYELIQEDGSHCWSSDYIWQPKQSAGGAILRNGKGTFMASITTNLNSTDIFAAELENIINAIQWAQNKVTTPLILHTDCKAITEALYTDRACISPTLKKFKDLVQETNLIVKHVQRD
ncbi:unnamed protein product, partial [Cuscuta campestris]